MIPGKGAVLAIMFEEATVAQNQSSITDNEIYSACCDCRADNIVMWVSVTPGGYQ